MRYIWILAICVALFSMQMAISDEKQLTQEQYLTEIKNIYESLDRQQGEVILPNGVASLNVPDSFYYLNPNDSEKILVNVWGNPPGASRDILGMLFPSETTPLDEGSWGVTIEYVEDGYVSDDNADDINYEGLLSEMKEGAVESSKQRVQQGYESIELIGWASKPYYDKQAHKLHWAKEIKFGSQEINTLNYNIRVLGRKGVLVLNFIAGMDQKEFIDTQIGTVLALAEFNQGSQYDDFDPSIDKVAAYGIGALVAGKVIAKTGLIAAALIFLKKFGVLIVIGVGVFLKKLFNRNKQSISSRINAETGGADKENEPDQPKPLS